MDSGAVGLENATNLARVRLMKTRRAALTASAETENMVVLLGRVSLLNNLMKPDGLGELREIHARGLEEWYPCMRRERAIVFELVGRIVG